MAFPRLNMASYWFFLGGVTGLASFGHARGSRPVRMDVSAPTASPSWRAWGLTMRPVGMIFLITSSLLGAVNFITTIIQLRVKGLTFMRFPFFVWAQPVTAFLLLLLAFSLPRTGWGHVARGSGRPGTSFFLPSGLVVSGQALTVAGGGNPLLWQHLFWFLADPEVYDPILPAMGIVAEIIANNTRKPLWGYRSMVYSCTSGVHVVHRVGAPHVHDRHGNGDGDVLPNDDDVDHLDPVGDHPHRPGYLAGAPIVAHQHAHALRGCLSPDVRHRRVDRGCRWA